MTAAVDQLHTHLVNLYVKILNNLSIGYGFEDNNLKEMMDIINAIDYIYNAYPSELETKQIINYYG